MKTLKFAPNLISSIINGEKTSTWRLFDDKNLRQGDTLLFINTENGEQFGTGSITSVVTKTLGALDDSDFVGHERYSSLEEMYSNFRKYYGDRVNENTEVKIVRFTLHS
jgi:hypothetical protein